MPNTRQTREIWTIAHFFLIFLFRPKRKNVRIIAVGIGKYKKFQGQLEEIAGRNVYNADNFDELSNLINDILVETCSK